MTRRRLVDIICTSVVVLSSVAILLLATSSYRSSRHLVTLKSIETIILDSMERKFVSPGDVEHFLEDYGPWRGQRLEDVDLVKMEDILRSKGAILESNAWTGDDGTLHVEITQRAPVVRFQIGTLGWYADASGFLFPLQERFPVRVPVVDGDIPLTLTPGFKGFPQSDEELEWLLRMTALATQMKGFWNGKISQINVAPDGELMLIPRVGDECFRFGSPTGIDEKFERLRLYYEYIAPSRESAYKNVDLRFDGQIVCR